MRCRNKNKQPAGNAQPTAFWLAWLLLAVWLLSGSICYAADDTHHLAFGSDRHQDTGAIGRTMGWMEDPEYVGLIGDMVNGSYHNTNVSVLADEVHAIFPDAVVQNIYGGHDYWMTEDVAGIMMCKGPGSSGLVYEGKNADGSAAYHIWGISYDNPTRGRSRRWEKADAGSMPMRRTAYMRE